ncbi:MAG: LLM class flavin-dependent oxidoreductase [bacterium]|nr:LLM class flavin-dependent oxidoreductase [bacterium]MDE0353109.1 LLM class flavin-dependent oxidoreductase [bacterium]
MTRATRYGICTDQSLPYRTLVDRWKYYEELGFDSIWDCDHFNRPSNPSDPYFEGWTLLAALAAETDRIRVGVLVASNTFRHPALVAQQAITIDHISGGRLELGLGAGWFEAEHEQFGIPLEDPPVRVAKFKEAVEVIDSLVRGRTTTYDGRYYRLRDAQLRPPPLQSPRPPLTLGAHRPRMLRICAEFADRWNSHGTVGEMAERNRLLDEACLEIGRDPSEITRSLYAWIPSLTTVGMPDPWTGPEAFAEVVGRYSEVGVNEFIFDQPRADQLGNAEAIAARVLR